MKPAKTKSEKESWRIFRESTVPLFAPVRRANLNGTAPWRFPDEVTGIDEQGKPIAAPGKE
jgi:hypothetical protein